jgi:UPF0271 protein
MLTHLDLNSDMGERDSAEGLALDDELMPMITSVNIACGGHAGSLELMRRTALVAARHGIAIGAHPGLPDRASFGRTEQRLPANDIATLVAEQVHALAGVLAQECLTLSHVKPHGALYNMAARDPVVARAVVDAVRRLDPKLLLYALAGSVLADLAHTVGLVVVHEAFADRSYRSDGTLVPRNQKGSVLEYDEDVRRQLHHILEGRVVTDDGATLPIRADSLCLHSDTPQSVRLARMIRRELDGTGITVGAVSHARR